jgi:hypothetical protein
MRGNPKPEIRRPKEARNPKAKDGSAVPNSATGHPFGFRVSAFGFPSDFGFRVSDFTLLPVSRA